MSTNLDGPEWAEGFRAGKAGDDETPPADIKTLSPGRAAIGKAWPFNGFISAC